MLAKTASPWADTLAVEVGSPPSALLISTGTDAKKRFERLRFVNVDPICPPSFVRTKIFNASEATRESEHRAFLAPQRPCTRDQETGLKLFSASNYSVHVRLVTKVFFQRPDDQTPHPLSIRYALSTS